MVRAELGREVSTQSYPDVADYTRLAPYRHTLKQPHLSVIFYSDEASSE